MRVWSLESGELVGRLDAPSAVHAVELITAADGKADPLVAISDDKLVRVYNTPTLPATVPNTPAGPTAAATTTDHSLIAVAGADGLVRVLNSAGAVSKEWKVPGAPINSLVFHPLATPPKENAAEPVPLIATAGTDGAVRLWNYATAEPVDSFHGSTVAIESLAFRVDGQQLVSGAADGSISVWNSEDVASEVFDGTVEQPGRAVALSVDGRQLATTGVNSGRAAITIFDLQTKKVSHTLLGHEGPIRSLAFSPDGLRLVSGSVDGSARIWNPGDSKFPEVVRFDGHAGEVTAVAFNSNATQVISGAANKTLKLWNSADAVEIIDLPGHAGAIVGVAFGSSNQPVSASADKTVRIWNPGKRPAGAHHYGPAAAGRDGDNT